MYSKEENLPLSRKSMNNCMWIFSNSLTPSIMIENQNFLYKINALFSLNRNSEVKLFSIIKEILNFAKMNVLTSNVSILFKYSNIVQAWKQYNKINKVVYPARAHCTVTLCLFGLFCLFFKSWKASEFTYCITLL